MMSSMKPYKWCSIICDVSSEKVPEPPYVNIEKIAKTQPKVNFAEFLFISLNDCLATEEWFLRVWRKISNVVFELIASLKVSIRHVFFNVRTHYIIYRETYIVSRKTDLKAIPRPLLLFFEI